MKKISYMNDASLDPDNVIRQSEGVFQSVIIIGWNKDKQLETRSSTNLTRKDILWIVEQFKLTLLS